MDKRTADLELLQLVDGGYAQCECRLVVAAVFFLEEEGLELVFQQLDVGEGGGEVDEDGDALFISTGAGDVLDALEGEAVVGDLKFGSIVYADEDLEYC